MLPVLINKRFKGLVHVIILNLEREREITTLYIFYFLF